MGTISSKVQTGGGLVPMQIDASGKFSPHVSFAEIANPSSGEAVILEILNASRLHNRCWEIWREWWGKPVTITCGYRTPAYNRKVGGVSDSLHLKTAAYDCAVGQISDALFKECQDVCYAIAKSHGTQCELGRYSWGLHIGFSALDYTDKTLYSFDKR